MPNSAITLVVFREILEIAMILGVVLAATRHMAGRGVWIGLGFAGGIAGAGLVAVFAGAISGMASGMGQEFFNAMVLFAAAIVIGWTVIWMRTHAREMAQHIKQVGHDVQSGRLPGFSLSLVIGLAMLREGSEIVLFLYGSLLQNADIGSIVSGALIGAALGALAGGMLYIGLVKLSSRYVLKVTSWLLVLLVAGLSAQGAQFLSAAGYFEQYSAVMWNSSWLLTDESALGSALHTLIGYSARPTQIEVMFYLGTLVLLLGTMRLTVRSHKSVAKTAPLSA